MLYSSQSIGKVLTYTIVSYCPNWLSTLKTPNNIKFMYSYGMTLKIRRII